MDVREKLALSVCNATQKTNYKCDFNCEKKGKCAYCLVMAEQMIANGVTVHENTEISDELLEQLRNAPVTILREEPTIEVVQKWISVKDDRKPKQLQECLCACQFDDDEKSEWRFFNVLKWHDVPYQDNGIVNRPHFTDEGVHGMIVTHWMPLPKLPQPPKGE